MGKIMDTLRSTYVGVLGNRITVAGATLMYYGLDRFFLTEVTGPISFLESLEGLGIATASTGILIATHFGTSTRKNYKAFRSKIRRTGRLDAETVEAVLREEGYQNNRIRGYCELQGAYFAAKEAGKLDEFRKIKKQVSKNIIPNF